MASHEEILRAHLDRTLGGVDDPAPSYRGKVRDVWSKGAEILLVASDRVSAFDVVLGTVPMKGQLLTEQSTFWLEKAASVVATHLIERVDAQAMRCRKTAAIPVELVVRGYLAGSLMREPKETRGKAYGVDVDADMPDFAPFATPIITPTTKEAVGVHDQPTSLSALVVSGRVPKQHLDACAAAALDLFRLGQEHAATCGLILVDTKYEFGVVDDKVLLIDEIHTADSSRFWVKASYAERVAKKAAPEMLDKERLRRWLIERGFSGSGTPPALSDDVRVDLAAHYWELTERVLGRPFAPTEGRAADRVRDVVKRFVA